MALTPEEVENKRFQPTKFREGYDQDQVDDFLDEVVAELRRQLGEIEDLRQKLSVCEQRVGEFSSGAEDRPVVAGAAMAPPPSAAGATAAAVGDRESPQAVTGMLALAQKLHDDHVRTGEEQRDKIVREAQERATRLVGDAEEKRSDTLGSLERDRSLLQRKIDELRAYEREYRSRLKAYLEDQLRELESRGSVASGGGQGTDERSEPAPAAGAGVAPQHT